MIQESLSSEHFLLWACLIAVIGMDGAIATMPHSDFKCPIGKGLVETMSHYFLET